MHQIFEPTYTILSSLRNEAADVLMNLPQDALDWKPAEHMSSIGVLVAHLAGSTSYWITDVAGQIDTKRNRDAEFQVKGEDGAALLARLDAALESARQTLDTFDVTDLTLERIARRDGRQVTVAWCMSHAVEHFGVHVGHLQVMRDMWNLGKR